MTCSSCVANIERNLSKVSGIHGILVALLSQKAEVLYDSDRIDASKIIELIEDMGYGASLLCDNVNTQLGEISIQIVGMSNSACALKIMSTLKAKNGN